MNSVAKNVKNVKGQNTGQTKEKTAGEQWTDRKRKGIMIAQKMEQFTELSARAERIRTCGDVIVAKYCPKCGVVHYVSAGMCRDRLCPLCQWRLVRARYKEMLKCLDLLHDDMKLQDVHASMLTLTLKNCDINHLAGTLKAITNAWREIARRAPIKRLYAWARALEITYNKQTKTYHPHLHIMLLWRGDMEDVATKAAFDAVAEWRKQLKLAYRPIWDYREAYNKHIDNDTVSEEDCYNVATEYDNATIAAAKECSKYIMKLDDLLECPTRDIPHVATAIKGVRFVGYGGALKSARAMLGYKDDEGTSSDDDDVHEQQCRECSSELKAAIMIWSGWGYKRAD